MLFRKQEKHQQQKLLSVTCFGMQAMKNLLCQLPTAVLCRKEPIKLTKTPWSESASELYRPSDRRLSAK
jgi:hypothetical protein